MDEVGCISYYSTGKHSMTIFELIKDIRKRGLVSIDLLSIGGGIYEKFCLQVLSVNGFSLFAIVFGGRSYLFIHLFWNSITIYD